MPPLYLVQQNTKIRIRNRRVQVEDDAVEPPQVLVSLPLAQVEQIVIFGNVGLTTPAVDAFLEQNSEVIFLSQRGEYRGRLVGRVTPHVPLRRAQYARTGDPLFTLEMAKGFVSAKLSHQRALLQRHNRERADPEIEAVIEQMRAALEGLVESGVVETVRDANTGEVRYSFPDKETGLRLLDESRRPL